MEEHKIFLKACAVPYKRHRNLFITDSFISVEADVMEYLQKICNIEICFEQKVCNFCYTQVTSDFDQYLSKTMDLNSQSNHQVIIVEDEMNLPSNLASSQRSNQLLSSQQSSSQKSSLYETESQKVRNLDALLDFLGFSSHKNFKCRRNQSLDVSFKIIQKIRTQVWSDLEDVYGVELPNLNNLKLLVSEEKWFEEVIANVKSKYEESSKNEKIRLLTLWPDDWNLEIVQKHFGCTKHRYY